MKDLVFAVLVVSVACNAQAQTVTGVSGTFNHGATVVVTGASFGTKAIAAPVVWDNLEDGACDIAATVGSWSNTGQLSLSSSNNRSANSSYSAGYNFTGANPEDLAYFQGGSDSPRWFAQYWFYLDSDFDWWPNLEGNLGNVKILRLWSTSGSSTNNLIVNTQGTFDILVNVMGRTVGFWAPVVAGHQTVNSVFGHANPSYVDGAHLGWREFENDITTGTWHLFQFQYSESSMNGYDGTLKWWLDGKLIFDKANIPTRWDAQPTSWRIKELGFYNSRSGDGTDTQNHFNLDDAYIDNSWARVELGNAPTYAACTHREIQIPTAWNANGQSINLTVNQGSFAAGAPAYLYVVSNSGVASNGYNVTVGGGIADTVPPTVNIVNPTSNGTTLSVTTNGVFITGTASDNSNVSRIEWSNSLGGGGTAVGTNSWSIPVIAAPDAVGVELQFGMNKITVTAFDAAGNSGTAFVNLDWRGPGQPGTMEF